MDFSRALTQIAEIHQQIAKGEVYRGYRSLPIAASGVVGLGAAWLQTPGMGASNPIEFVIYWAAVGACAGFIGVSEIVYNYIVHENMIERRRTRQVIGQFMPSVLAGALIAVALVHLSADFVPLLPGIWAICFGVGVFASRPYLPRASGFVALFYYAAGVALLWIGGGGETLNGWRVGGTFGVGQLFAALVLYWNLERNTE
jgi:hypothetical protein